MSKVCDKKSAFRIRRNVNLILINDCQLFFSVEPFLNIFKESVSNWTKTHIVVIHFPGQSSKIPLKPSFYLSVDMMGWHEDKLATLAVNCPCSLFMAKGPNSR